MRSERRATRRLRRRRWWRKHRRLRALLVMLALLLAAEPAYRLVLVAQRVLGPDEGPRFELYGLGGSSMVGEPYHSVFSLPQLVAEGLGGEVDGLPFRPILLAQRGSSLFPQLVRFQRAVASRDRAIPGAVLVYSGHNETPLGPDEWAPLSNRVFVWLEGAAAGRSLLLSAVLEWLREHRGSPWRTVPADYEQRLRDVVRTAREAGLVPILATVVGNLTGMEPGTPPGAAREVVALADSLAADPAAGPGIARTRLLEAVARDPALGPYARWRLAGLLVSWGRFEEAEATYWEAAGIMTTGYYRRASARQNEIVRRVAAELDCPLFDAVEAFRARSPDGLVGWNLFADGHHPNAEGYALLATGLAETLATALGQPLARRFDSGEALMAYAAPSPAEWAAIHQSSGHWLLWSTAGLDTQRSLRQRAAREFREALRWQPESLTLWLNLAVAEASLDSDVLVDREKMKTVAAIAVPHFHPTGIEAEEAALQAGLALVRPHARPETMARIDALLATQAR